ncbi:hypothetical protein M9Y10_024657 [Tritrichomonas musculus]|uniref:F5/8 type C domain-containing protein n=1 Tax=Tritrichomonas musculus TaxID=1915356 RepID=A0ABR2HAX5_9EUKA
MTEKTKIQLNPNRISQIPLHTYECDFMFVVNDEIFKTSKIISDLISPIICQQHINDATTDTFTIHTVNQGDFSHVLNLVNFQPNSIPDSEIPFFHFLKYLRKDVEYISSNFFSLCETHSSELAELSPTTLERIISNEHLTLNNEDQLVTFLNQLYSHSGKINMNLYEYVIFSNVGLEAISSFVDLFDYNDFNRQLWDSVSRRLKMPVIKTNEDLNVRYKNLNFSCKVFPPQSTDRFSGIIKYLRNKAGDDIGSKISITASSTNGPEYNPNNVIIYEDNYKRFQSENIPNSWICFEFKENKVVPTHYQIMPCCSPNYSNPKSWVIEGSNDDINWELLDERINCSDLNYPYKPKIFNISNPNKNEFRFIRMRLTGPTWYDSNYFIFCSFELYGKMYYNSQIIF